MFGVRVLSKKPCFAVRNFAAAAPLIPINGTSRMVRVKVSGEPDAVKAQEVMAKAHMIMKKEAKGYVGATRFLCKSEFDMMFFFRFADLDSLKNYMGSETREKKVLPLLKDMDKLDVNGKAHAQNFIVDDW